MIEYTFSAQRVLLKPFLYDAVASRQVHDLLHEASDGLFLIGVTGHALAQITEQETCIANNTRGRTPDKRTRGNEEAVKTNRTRKLCLEGKVYMFIEYG